MIIDHLTVHNFGAFKGENRLELAPNSEAQPIVLVGAQNGSGKTTLLQAIQLVLYGRQAPYLRHERKAYDKHLSEMIHRGVSKKDGAEIRLRFHVVENGRDVAYDVRRTWSAKGSGMSENVDIFVDGVRISSLADVWAQEVHRFLAPNLAEFFLFDGEKIDALASPRQSGSILRLAIHALLGVDLVDKLGNDLSVLVRRQQESIVGDTADDELVPLEEQRQSLRQQVVGLKESLAEIESQLDHARSAFERACTAFSNHGGELYEEKSTLERKYAALKERAKLSRERLTALVSDATPLLLVRDKLSSISKRAEVSLHATHAAIKREGFLTRDAHLLRWLRDNMTDSEMLSAFEEYLQRDIEENWTPDSEVELDGLDTENVHRLIDLHRETLPQCSTELERLVNEHRDSLVAIDEIESLLARTPDSDDIAALLQERLVRQVELQTLEKTKADAEAKLRTEVQQLDTVESRISKVLEQRASQEIHNDRVERTINHAKTAQATLQKFRDRLIEYRMHELEEFISFRLKALLRKTSLAESVHINRTDYSPMLKQKDGTTIPLASLSAGESQMLAIAILWGLSEATGKSIPVVVDTPLARLDLDHRQRLVDEYFPNASHQVIVLSTDTEVDDPLYQRLQPYVSRAYLLHHEDSEKATGVTSGYFGEAA